MGLLDSILNAAGGSAVHEIGSSVGLGSDQTASALSALIPALAAGVQQNTQSGDGLAGLMAALTSGQHQQYVNDPSSLRNSAAIDDGNAILGHLLGSKDASRQVASQAAAQTGIGADVLKKMLPMAATLVMGALAQHTAQSSSPGAPGQAAGGLQNLTALLEEAAGGSSQSGEIAGVVGMLGKMFGR